MLALGVLPACHKGVKTTRFRPAPAEPAPKARFFDRAFPFQGQEHKYAIYAPPGAAPDAGWPAILFLHGSGERGDDNVAQTRVGIGPAILAHPERFPCVVVMPQCPKGPRWEGALNEMALAALDDASAAYPIDQERLALTGLSMGGFGTWAIAAEHPGRFRVLAPVCGGGEPQRAALLARTPIWCWHGAADTAVPAARSREMVAAVQAAGGEVRYTEVEHIGHNSWDSAYASPELIRWLIGDE